MTTHTDDQTEGNDVGDDDESDDGDDDDTVKDSHHR